MNRTRFPTMVRVRQRFKSRAIANPQQELSIELCRHRALKTLKPGMQVAIAVGSRGMGDIVALTATLVEDLKRRGADPFFFPAMGSQGGATPEGQAAVLRELGITEENTGAPIRSLASVVKIGATSGGQPIYCDEAAYQSDLIIVVNRIKPHTAFKANIESGLMKMMAVGLGKRESAQAIHSSPTGLAKAILESARAVMRNAPIGLGIGIVEDAFGSTARIAVLEPDEIEETEKELLEEAKQMMPRIPFEHVDVLIVEEMGKDISGAGMDPNVIGMARRLTECRESKPTIDRIVVLDLTKESQGNAEGVGLADVVTQRLVSKIDFRATYINCITSGFLRGGMVPITADTDKEAIEIALSGYPADRVRVVRIENTLKLEEMDVSESLLGEVRRQDDLTIIGKDFTLTFSDSSCLV